MGLSEKYVKLILYLVVIVLLNIAGSSFFFRIDLTQDKKYSLSPISKQSVQDLSEPLTIKAFFSSELPPQYNTVERYFRDLLTEFSRHSNANFNFSFYSIGPDSKKERQMASDYGIHPVQVQVVQKDELKYKKAYLGAVILHGDAMEKLSTITSSSNLEYRLTSAIQNLKNTVSALLNIKKPIHARLYLSSTLETIAPSIGLDNLPDLPNKLKKMIGKINNQYYNKLKFQNIDPSRLTAKRQEQLSRYQLQKLEWPNIEKAGIDEGKGQIGLVLKHKDQFRTISLLQIMRVPLLGTQYNLIDQEKLKDSIQENVRSLLGIQQNIGYLADHGTPSISKYAQRGSNSLTAFNELISKNYNLQKINLDQGIPDGLPCMIIAGPQEKFSDYELYQLDQAIMHGTNLAFFLDSFVQKKMSRRQQMMARSQGYRPNKTGLGKLLSHYGLETQEAIVLDKHCYKQQQSQERGGGERPIYFAPIIKNKNINHDLPFMKNIKGLVGFKMSPVRTTQNNSKTGSLQSTRLISSSERSWLMKDRVQFNPLMIQPPNAKDNMGQYPLAYLLSGRFESFFSNRPIPEKESKDNSTASKETGAKKGKPVVEPDIEYKGAKLDHVDSGQIFLMASSKMLTDTVLEAEGQSPNSIFVMNIIDRLNNRGEMAELRSKVQKFNPLRETNQATRLGLKIANIAGLPFLVLVFGLFVWLRRSQRKRHIQSLFGQG